MVDLLSESPEFSFVFPGQNNSQETSAVSRTDAASSLCDSTFTWILSLNSKSLFPDSNNSPLFWLSLVLTAGHITDEEKYFRVLSHRPGQHY